MSKEASGEKSARNESTAKFLRDIRLIIESAMLCTEPRVQTIRIRREHHASSANFSKRMPYEDTIIATLTSQGFSVRVEDEYSHHYSVYGNHVTACYAPSRVYIIENLWFSGN